MNTRTFFLISLIIPLTLILGNCADQPDLTQKPIKRFSGPIKTAKITVTNFPCPKCPLELKFALLKTSGIESVEASQSGQDNVVIRFYSDHLDISEIEKIIKEQGRTISLIKVEP